MGPEDIVIEVRNSAFKRKGQIDIDDVQTGQFIKRANAVGAWKLTVPSDVPLCQLLKTPGSGVLVWLYDKVYLSGPMISWTNDATQDDPIGTSTFVGADDLVLLADAAAYPTPSTANLGQQTASYDTRAGKIETVIKSFLAANIGPGAPAERREALALAMRIENDLARGGQVTGSARFDKLGELFAALCAVDGSLGFDLVQDANTPTTLFMMYDVRDRSKLVRMDIENEMLDNTSSGIAAPKTTLAIVAGSGSGSSRTFVGVNDAESLAAQRSWGRRIETFIDQRSTNDIGQLQQAGAEEIQTNGRTTVSLKVTPADSDSFARDWKTGDKVGVVVDDQVLVDVVTESIIAIDQSSVKLGATIGDPVGYDWEAEITRQVSQQSSRIAMLERSL